MDLIICKISLAFKCKFYFQYKCEMRIFDMKLVKKLMRDNKGATAVEYAIIATLVAVATVAGFTALGTGIGGGMTSVAGQVS